jgi:hypothetical protein
VEAIGRLINVLPVADDVYVDLERASAVTFVGVNTAGETWTLTEQKADGSGDQVLATIERYLVSATVGAAWQELTQAAASTVVTTAAQDVVVIHVGAAELSQDYTQVKLASTGAGTVVAITHDLLQQRAPSLLPAMV